jgi:pimeloyl-ACP methyl ester carboxylesterase
MPMMASSYTTRKQGKELLSCLCTNLPAIAVAGNLKFAIFLDVFSRRYRCITYNARGYPPSDVTDDPDSYSQQRAADDIVTIVDHLGFDQAHVVGLSMGGFATLHFGLRHGQRTCSLVIAGCGYDAKPESRTQFEQGAEATARLFENRDSEAAAEIYAMSPGRGQFRDKDPRGWREFADMLGEHSALGAAMTMRRVQKLRPSLWDLTDRMAKLTTPTLIITGDEDEPCLEPGLLMKRSIPTAGLVVIPRSGHTVNLEEPAAFNSAVQDFIATVDAGRWSVRDPAPGSGDSDLLSVR